MDGVLSHFDQMWKKHSPDNYHERNRLPKKEFWAQIKAIPKFWEDMPLFPGAHELVKYVTSLGVPVEILTAPLRSDPTCIPGKTMWAKKHGFDFPINFSDAKDKRKYAKEGHILIDDKYKNCIEFTKDGGIGIFHRQVEDTIKNLKELKK